MGVVLTEGLYLTFMLGKETFALPTSYVREIRPFGEVTQITGVPEFVLGVARVRNELVPIVDLRLRLGYPLLRVTPITPVIFVCIDRPVGFVVDAVSDVVRFLNPMMRPRPDLFAFHESVVVAGFGILDGSTLLLLNEVSLRSIQRECRLPLPDGAGNRLTAFPVPTRLEPAQP